ncbi:distal tail protein Dit [Alkalibacillus sp. S2W]|uniref:distal tail protein Dit n=1 Tax=Alkalibacillus sp. S2W TaxID=3386553 RepID=UPI00398D0131
MLFNGIDLNPYLKIKSIQGRGMTNATVEMTDLTGTDGSHFRRRTRGPRSITIDADIRGTDREDIRRKIEDVNGILDVNNPVPIEFPDEKGKIYYGVPEASSEDDEYFFKHQGQLTIICPKPDKIGAQIKKTLGNSTSSIYYEGTAKTRPIINVTFSESASFYEVENQDGLKVKINYDFQPSDELELNFQTQKITINGELQMTSLAWSVSDWFFIEPGYNTLQSSQQAKMRYVKKWK